MFRNPPCYERFVQLIPSLFLPLIVMLHYLSRERTGIYYADSTHLQYVKISELILTELLIILQKWDVVLSIGFLDSSFI
nr:hypothetical protein RMONA_6900 [Rickettsia monacensis IrR/Munich]